MGVEVTGKSTDAGKGETKANVREKGENTYDSDQPK